MNTERGNASFFSEKPKYLVIFEVMFKKKKFHNKLQPIPEKLAFSTFKKLIMVKNGNFLKKRRFLTVFWSFLVTGCVF